MSAGAAGMDDALGDALAVEACELLDKVEVFQEHAAIGAGGLGVLVAAEHPS